MSIQPELIDLIYDHLNGQVGAQVFLYSMPADVQFGVLVRENMPGARIAGDTGTRTTGFQLICRSRDYIQARELARLASARVCEFSGNQAQYDVRAMYQINEPFPFPLSAGDMVEFVVNFSCQYGVL